MGKVDKKRKVKQKSHGVPISRALNQVQPPKDDFISISYRYFINDYFCDRKFNNHFKDSEHCGDFMHNVHLLLQELSVKKKSEILNKSYQSQMNMHPLKDKALSIFLGLASHLQQVDKSEIYQIKANSASDGRVIFYIQETTIFVLLYDPNHLLYRMDQYGAKEAIKHSYSPVKSSS